MKEIIIHTPVKDLIGIAILGLLIVGGIIYTVACGIKALVEKHRKNRRK